MRIFEPDKFTILMVDDIPKNLQVLGSTLKGQGYKVEFATSGIQALDWLNKKEFDLILLDVMMPEMDGFETCQKIRKNEKHFDVPVIFLTAKTDKDSIVKGLESGAQDYVAKPFDNKELLSRVQTQLDLIQSKKELRELNTTLEVKVAQRTQELQKANERLENQNIDLEKMYRELFDLDTTKTEFLNIISHQIRTPLNGVLGFLEMIKMNIQDKSLQKYIENLDGSMKKLERFLLNAILFTELRAKKRKVTLQRIMVKELLNELIDHQFKPIMDAKDIEVVVNILDDDQIVKADKEMIKACFSSILNNAIRFTPEGGIVNIYANRENGNTNIEFVDNGVGFSNYALKDLFKPFATGEQFTEDSTGMDLALANLIMETHGGSVVARNNKTKGATVSLCFVNA